MERPALQGLLADIRAGRIDILVIYKVDRLTQSLANFARLVEIFDAQDATFVPLRRSSRRRARCGAPHAQFAAHHRFSPLPRIPAIVSFLNPQPALSLVGGNRSSCP